jgi:hypothetical protein
MFLDLNQDVYYPGDPFVFGTDVRNPGEAPQAADQYILLDVYGDYYFWPSWGRDVDKEQRIFPPGQTLKLILDIIWPDGVGEAFGLGFWGALLRPDTVELITMDHLTFGFSEHPPATPTPGPGASPTPRPSPTPSPTPTPTSGGGIPLQVPGNVDWLDTGLDVQAGALWRIAAWGEICFHRGDCDGTRVGPCGLPDVCYDRECQEQPFDPGYHHGALIGRVGATGTIFLVCESFAEPMPQSGRLFLGINDGNVTDNDLAFNVELYPPAKRPTRHSASPEQSADPAQPW